MTKLRKLPEHWVKFIEKRTKEFPNDNPSNHLYSLIDKILWSDTPEEDFWGEAYDYEIRDIDDNLDKLFNDYLKTKT